MARISYSGRVAKVPKPSGEPMLPIYKDYIKPEELEYNDACKKEGLERLIKKYGPLVEEWLETRQKIG